MRRAVISWVVFSLVLGLFAPALGSAAPHPFSVHHHPPLLKADSSKMTSRATETVALYAELERIVHQLAGDDAFAYLGFIPEFRVASTELPNAFAQQPNRILITSGLVGLTHNSAELAFIVAHELSHHLLKHSQPNPGLAPVVPVRANEFHQEWEYEADAKGVFMMESAGFDPCAAVTVLARLAETVATGHSGRAAKTLLSRRIARIERSCT